MLMMLLQRTPVLSVVAATEEIIIASPVGAMLKAVVAAVAALGAVNTLVGATPLGTSAGSSTGITVPTGAAMSVSFSLPGPDSTPDPTAKWTLGIATGSSFPPGLNFSGLTVAGTANVKFPQLSGTPTTAGTYNLTLQAFSADNVFSSAVFSYMVTVTAADTGPAITTQPVSQTVTAGNPVTFTAAASGTPTPTFQWQKNSVDIGGATSSTFTIASTAAGDAGTYRVVATNSVSSATSNGATLTVNAANTAPAITTQPVSQTVTAGNPVTFTAAASGTPAPTFQWQKDSVNIGGATSSSYTIASTVTGDAGSYTVMATNSVSSVTSNAATLTVNVATAAPTFTAQPISQTVTAGNPVTFTAAASGAPAPTYQWRKDNIDINGATGSSYTIASVVPAHAGAYTVVATNSISSTTSNAATLTVNTVPVITTQPVGQTVTVGRPVTFTAAASGSPAPTFQWRMNNVNIGGATGSSYTIASAALGDAGSYTVMATNVAGSVTSNPAMLTVLNSGTGDFNSDGQTDILWQNTVTGQRALWLMNGIQNGFTPASIVDLGFVTIDWVIAGTGDFNSDNQTDILWQNTVTGQRALWLMNGIQNGFTPASIVDLGLVTTDWVIAGTGDFNSDGQTDILWQNTVTGQRALWLMNGIQSGFTPASIVDLGLVTTDWVIAGTGDFNGDSQTDILWQNTVSGQRALWLMNGIQSGFTPASIVDLGLVTTDWVIAGTGDFNSDGQTDILWQNTVTGQRALWLMNGINSGFTPASIVDLGFVITDWVIAN